MIFGNILANLAIFWRFLARNYHFDDFWPTICQRSSKFSTISLKFRERSLEFTPKSRTLIKIAIATFRPKPWIFANSSQSNDTSQVFVNRLEAAGRDTCRGVDCYTNAARLAQWAVRFRGPLPSEHERNNIPVFAKKHTLGKFDAKGFFRPGALHPT